MSYLYTRDPAPGNDDLAEYLNRQFKKVEDHTRSSIDELDTLVALILRVLMEKAWLSDSDGLTIGAGIGQPNVLQSWDTFNVVSAVYTGIEGVPATGVITIVEAGRYRFSGQLTYIGSGTNQTYAIGFSLNGGAPVKLQSNNWTNQAADQFFSWSLVSDNALSVGDTIEITMAAGGSFTSTIAQSFVEFIGL